VTTFNGRFIPAVRQLISIPAWVFHMNFPKFLFFTGLWAGIWNMILLGIWYVAWENKELIAEYSHEAILWTFWLIIIVSIVYYCIDKYSLKN
jgi:membrane protein DedA with SNARE-associated domain